MENVQRQEVKKPILLKDVEVPSEWKDFGQVMLKCPTCGHTWNGFKNHDKYCSECGQKFEEKQTETENEAMEKQIPKKPVFLEPFEVEGFNETIDDLWDCPGCGHTWGSEKGVLKYCPECGQKLNWT